MVENLNDRRLLNRYLLSQDKKGSLSLVVEGDLYGETRYSLVTERVTNETAIAFRFFKHQLLFPDSCNALDGDELTDFDREIEEIPSWQGWAIIQCLKLLRRQK